MNITVRTLAGDLPLSGVDPGMTVANVLQALVGAARQAGVEELPSRLVRRPAAPPVPRVPRPAPPILTIARVLLLRCSRAER